MRGYPGRQRAQKSEARGAYIFGLLIWRQRGQRRIAQFFGQLNLWKHIVLSPVNGGYPDRQRTQLPAEWFLCKTSLMSTMSTGCFGDKLGIFFMPFSVSERCPNRTLVGHVVGACPSTPKRQTEKETTAWNRGASRFCHTSFSCFPTFCSPTPRIILNTWPLFFDYIHHKAISTVQVNPDSPFF